MADLNQVHKDIGKLLEGIENLKDDVKEIKEDLVPRINSLERSRSRLKGYAAGLAISAGVFGATIAKLTKGVFIGGI